MTSEIKTYIDQIAEKSLQLHQLLVAERERSASMLQEVSRLNEVVEQQEQENVSLQKELTNLQTKLTEQREQVQEIKSSVKEFEIDGLVKEIDFCIQQLKIANG